jgi:sugar/nucleoside kinase (ribokinase family)
MSLITLGTVALDTIRTDTGIEKDLLGGSAVHFAMSARLFTSVHLVSIVGVDFPKAHYDFLKKKGVNLTSVIERDGKSFRWEGEYQKGNYNTAITLSTELGVLLNYSPQVAFEQKDIPYVFLANFDPDIQSEFLHLMKKPRFVGMDTMNLWIANKQKAVKQLMKRVDLFIVNDGEARSLAEETSIMKAAKVLRRMGPRIIVIKKGEHGVYVHTDRFHFSFSAFPIEGVVDPTGAGDTFAGGLMGFLTKTKKTDEKTLRQAAVYATALASYNVEGFGTARTAPLTLSEVNKRKNQLLKFITP